MIPIANSLSGASASSNPGSFVRAGNKVFFKASDGVHGSEPWVTDGTTAGTTMVADIYPGGGESSAFMIGGIGPVAIFTAYDGSGSALWRSDGTPSGTSKLLTLPGVSSTIAAVVAGSRAFVVIGSGDTIQILVTDGTVAGTQNLGAYPVIGSSILGANGNLYFVVQDATVGAQLFVSDGTVVGTHMVRRDVECPGASCGPVPKSFFRIGDNVLFLTSDGLWKTDGTGPGTQLVASIPNATILATSPSAPVAYLTAQDGTAWKSDGTAAGTQQFGSWGPTSNGLVLDDGRLFFLHSSSSALEVWKSDGTVNGTVKIGSIVQHSSQFPPVVGAQGARVFLESWTQFTGTELWTADLDSGTVSLLKDLDPRNGTSGPSSSSPASGISLGSLFLFSAADVSGRELWQSDGTAAGTKQLANIAADPGGGIISGDVHAVADGTPINGATVFLCPPTGFGGCDTTFTEASGHYHFDGVIPGTYKVASSTRSYVVQEYDGSNCPCTPGTSTPVVVTSGFETANVDFSLILGGTFAGTVTRASTGLPIVDAEVDIVDVNHTVVDREFTDSAGKYKSRGFLTGTYHAVASTDFSSPSWPSVQQVYNGHNCPPTGCDVLGGDAISVTNGADVTGIDFPLHEYGTISGTVRDDTGSGVPSLSVMISRDGSSQNGVTVTTDVNGHYLSPLLNPGSYYIVTGEGRGFTRVVYPNVPCPSSNCTVTNGTPVPVAIDGATTGIDFDLTITAARLTGTLRDRTGAPFSGIAVSLLDSNGHAVNTNPFAPTTDANGRYELYSIPAGTYYLAALNELYPGVDCPVSCLPDATPLVLTNGHTAHADMQLLSQRTTISGRVLDAVTGLQILTTSGVSLYTATGAAVGSYFVDSGSYNVTLISREATFYLSASASGYHTVLYKTVSWNCPSAPCVIPAEATPIPAGANSHIDFLLPRTGWLSGTVTDKVTGAPASNVIVSLTPVAGGGGTFTNAATDFNGHYKAFAAPGQYQADAKQFGANPHQSQVFRDHDCASTCDPSTGEMITVTDGVETTGIDFHLAPSGLYGTISGHVFDAETNLPMANVYVGIANNTLSARTDEHGFYSISQRSDGGVGLTTGQYAVYAETDQPYYVGLSGGGNCPDFYACYNSGVPVQVTTPGVTTVDFRLIKLGISSVTPAYGPAAGGTQITINGANFTQGATISIGGNAATVVSISPTKIVATTPAASALGPAHITVRLSAYLAVTFVQSFTYLPVTTFTDDPLVARATVMRASHIIELRAAVNRLRAAALLASYPFTDPGVSGGLIRAIHIVELRTALNQARAALGLPVLTFTNAIAQGGVIHAIDIAELRDGPR
jgi:ELWxxDGT repeat protein